VNKKLATITMILVLAITTLIGGISIAKAQPPGPDKHLSEEYQLPKHSHQALTRRPSLLLV